MKDVLSNILKFITFRATFEDFDEWDWRHFAVGLFGTWLVGIARNWDFPDAPLFARLGLPSVVYVFLLSMVLFAFAWPVSGERRNYWHVLTMVVLTSFPGLIYGIPVEMMIGGTAAQQINVGFLAFVATWRVALAMFYLIRACDTNWGTALSVLLLPICGLILALIFSGRAGVVFEIMGGLNRDTTAPDYEVQNVLVSLGFFSCMGLPIAALLYIGTLVSGWGKKD